MGRRCKVDDATLLTAYAVLNNVWKVGKTVGLCGQSVHERLCKLGVIHKINVFTAENDEILLVNYQFYRDRGELNILAARLERTVPFICRQAKRLGLTDKNRNAGWMERERSNPYGKYHARVRSSRGVPKECDVCGKKDPTIWYDWANLTGKYEDIHDYQRMCRVCHRAYDKNRPVHHASL